MVYLATNNGFVTADPADHWRITSRSLDGLPVTSVSAWGDAVLAGTSQGIYRSDDRGLNWREANDGLNQRHVRWLAGYPESGGHQFAGTEPAAIYISSDSGDTWRECSEVAQLRDRFHWSLPYSPAAGCVRGFAFHGNRAYAAVEVGGALRSDDRGLTWRLAEGSEGRPSFSRPAEPLIHPDVHSISTHPSSPDLVFAPTGGGFYTSTDAGKTWRCRYVCYVRAAWIDPLDARHIILGPADGVDRNGRIEETYDGGDTWQPAADGLAVPWSGHMVERFTLIGTDLAAVLSNGEVVVRSLAGGPWRMVLGEVVGVNAMKG